MIQITQITQFNDACLTNLQSDLAQDSPYLSTFQGTTETNFYQAQKLGAGFFVMSKAGQVIGYGSVESSPEAPPTAGIALIQHCFIIPSERQKGYGTQLFRQLKQHAKLHFEILQLKEDCPLWRPSHTYIDLSN